MPYKVKQRSSHDTLASLCPLACSQVREPGGRLCDRILTTEQVELGSCTSMFPCVASRCPTYRENSHANHTWHPHPQETACFIVPAAPPLWVRFPSPAPPPGEPQEVGTRDWGQDFDLSGKSWEFESIWQESRSPCIDPTFTYVTSSDFQEYFAAWLVTVV